jgi:hypothetical protein
LTFHNNNTLIKDAHVSGSCSSFLSFRGHTIWYDLHW